MIWERCCRWGKSIFGWLNGFGALLLGFALVNPDARALFADALAALPEPWRTVAGIILPLIWFAIVQKAKQREVKKAVERAG